MPYFFNFFYFLRQIVQLSPPTLHLTRYVYVNSRFSLTQLSQMEVLNYFSFFIYIYKISLFYSISLFPFSSHYLTVKSFISRITSLDFCHGYGNSVHVEWFPGEGELRGVGVVKLFRNLPIVVLQEHYIHCVREILLSHGYDIMFQTCACCLCRMVLLLLYMYYCIQMILKLLKQLYTFVTKYGHFNLIFNFAQTIIFSAAHNAFQK